MVKISIAFIVSVCWLATTKVKNASAASADNIAALLATTSVNCSRFPATERDLRTKLLTNYSRIDRPKKNPQETVTIIFSLVLESIKDVAIKEHSITVSGYLYVNWYDDYLVWNNLPEYQCIKLLVITASQVWLPDIAMMNVPQKYQLFEAPGEKVRLYPDGYVHFRPGGLFSATCEMDLTYFPYDEQECKLRFQSWLYLHSFMTITLDKNPVVQSRWVDNEEWELTNMSGIIQNVYYSNPAHPYDGVIFTLNLRRRVGFFIMNVIIPGTIISLVEIVTFSLDAGEPVKIHISFTCLLAFQVFQLMVIPEMPHSAMHTPLLSIYIILEMSYIGCVLLGQGVVFVMLHHSGKRKAPPRRMVDFAMFWASFVRVKIPAEDIEPGSTAAHDAEDDEELTIPFADQHGAKYYPAGINANMSQEELQIRQNAAITSMFDSGKDIFDTSMSKFYNNELEQDQKMAQGKFKRRSERHNKKLWVFTITVVDRVFACFYLFLVIITPLFMFMIIPAARFQMVRTLR